MADNRPPLQNPFADRQRQTKFNDVPKMDGSDRRPFMQPYESQISLPHDGHHEEYDDDEYVEKQPLNVGQNFSGGFYPPA